MFEEIVHVGLRGPGGVPFRSMHSQGIGGLSFDGCKSLRRIPEGLGGLTCLKKLYMCDCEALEEFPSGVCTLKALEEL